jgi:ferredoxin-NADP reductase
MSLPPVVAPAVRTLRVRTFERVTADAAQLTLDLDGRPFDFTAGQAAWLGRHGQGIRRPYSLALSPAEAARTARLAFLVGLEADGTPGEHMQGLEAGTPMDVDGPVGAFNLPPLAERPSLLFLAGGTGIAPLRAMLHEVIETRPGARIHLLYSARSFAHLACRHEWRALEDARRLSLDITLSREAPAGWKGGVGRVAPAALAPHVGPDTMALLCGPKGFVETVTRYLRELGLPEERIRREDW